MYKKLIYCFLLITSNVLAQGTTNFEIWGWEGEKKDFVKQYEDSIGTNLNYGYTCMADLKKMGFDHSISQIWVEDLQDYLSGKLNWDSTERLAIIRQINFGKNAMLSEKMSEKIRVAALSLFEKDSVYIAERLCFNTELKELILLGTLSSKSDLRSMCLEIFSPLRDHNFELIEMELEIMAEMLSFPDPSTTYLAIHLIKSANISQQANSILFSQNALTITDFLNSSLQTFREDAVEFLKIRFPSMKLNSAQEWITVIKNMN